MFEKPIDVIIVDNGKTAFKNLYMCQEVCGRGGGGVPRQLTT